MVSQRSTVTKDRPDRFAVSASPKRLYLRAFVGWHFIHVPGHHVKLPYLTQTGDVKMSNSFELNAIRNLAIRILRNGDWKSANAASSILDHIEDIERPDSESDYNVYAIFEWSDGRSRIVGLYKTYAEARLCADPP